MNSMLIRHNITEKLLNAKLNSLHSTPPMTTPTATWPKHRIGNNKDVLLIAWTSSSALRSGLAKRQMIFWPRRLAANGLAPNQPNRKSRDCGTNSPSRQLRFIDNSQGVSSASCIAFGLLTEAKTRPSTASFSSTIWLLVRGVNSEFLIKIIVQI